MTELETRRLTICRRSWDLLSDPVEWSEDSDDTPHVPWNTKVVEPDEPAFSYVAACIEKAIQLLHTPKSKTVLAKMAEIFICACPDLKYDFSDYDTAYRWVDKTFLERISKKFPLVCIDGRTVEGAGAWTDREVGEEGEWVKASHLFLNAKNIKTLEELAAITKRSDTSNGKYARYKDYMVGIIIHLLHEVGGHILIAHITAGQKFRGTPIELKDDQTDWEGFNMAGKHKDRGEAGFWFINKAFGIGWEAQAFDEKDVHILLKKPVPRGVKQECWKPPIETINAILKGEASAFSDKTGAALDFPPLPPKAGSEETDEPKKKANTLDLEKVKNPPQPIDVIIGRQSSIHEVPFDPEKRVEIKGFQEKRKHETSSESESGLRAGPTAGGSKGSAGKKRQQSKTR